MPLVRVDGAQLSDWDSFHDVFSTAFGFPAFYGRNLHAWIDCMTSLDQPGDAMTAIHGSATDPVAIHVANADQIPTDIFEAFTNSAAFVNWRRIEAGEPAILTLSYLRPEPREENSQEPH